MFKRDYATWGAYEVTLTSKAGFVGLRNAVVSFSSSIG